MNQPNESTLKQFANQYTTLWNESNAELRRASIAELWAQDGAQFTSAHAYHGYQELEERVTSAYEQFVKTGGCVFRPSSEVEAHHNAIKLIWEMVPAAGGAVAATGIIFLVLDDEGRIRLDYHF
jgi:hypothetical protein